MNLTRFSDPERIVLGGGLLTDDFLLDRIRARLHAHTMRYVTGGVVHTATPAPTNKIASAMVVMNAAMQLGSFIASHNRST